MALRQPYLTQSEISRDKSAQTNGASGPWRWILRRDESPGGGATSLHDLCNCRVLKYLRRASVQLLQIRLQYGPYSFVLAKGSGALPIIVEDFVFTCVGQYLPDPLGI
jgi:hypothetical protein